MLSVDDMDFLVSRLEGKLKRAWTEMVRSIKSDNSLADLQLKISTGNLADMLTGVADAAEKYVLDVNGGYVAAGQKAARALDKLVDPTIRFDFSSQDATAWMSRHLDEFVQKMVQEQQAVAQRVVSIGRERNWSDADIADEVRASIGLNTYQVDVIDRYRDGLEGGDYASVMGRELTDGRYEAAIGRARENGTFFSPDRVDAMVDSYRDNFVDFRGENMATYEAELATNEGVDEMLDQAVQDDDVAAAAIDRTWWTRGDSHVRGSHRAMHGQTQPFGVPFMSGMGNELMYPGDEDAPDEDTAGCRCLVTVSLRT